MTVSFKKFLRWMGGLIALLGVLFVTQRLLDYSSQFDFTHFNSSMWLTVIGFSLIYGVNNIVLALAWKGLLSDCGEVITPLKAVKIYGITQLAKYVPGNIFHLASRQALGIAAGVNGWPLAKASIWELGLISLAGASFFVLVLPQIFPTFTMPIAVISFVGILIIAVFGLKQYFSIQIARVFVWYILFLTVSGLLFVGLLQLVIQDAFIVTSLVPVLFGAFVLAWLVGLITPGAPAGVGVRELVLVLLMQGLVIESNLILAVLLSRIVTVSGDVLFFFVASILPDGRPE